jgi:cytochrome c-type biogenesis protein CcmE
LSALEGEETPLLVAAQRPRSRLRRLLMVVLAILVAQYTITSLIVGVSVAATLHYFVTPQIVAKFEALAIALKR